ncbi:MAG: DUF4340 domain-containing protein [Anaerolineales bacterium]|jgi:uncharacterized protein YpmB|nr:DUF4340 domain-containing protein [Anaerolineales bacterium]
MLKRSTLIIVVIFIVILVAAVLFQRNQDKVDTESMSATDQTYLIDIGEYEIISLEVNGVNESQVIVKRDTEGSWVLVEPPSIDADETRIEAAVSQAGRLETLSKFESKIDLGDLGLDPANYWINVTLSNGEQKSAFIGNNTPTNSGYYAYMNGAPLQVVNKYNVDSLLEILNSPPILVQPEDVEIE